LRLNRPTAEPPRRSDVATQRCAPHDARPWGRDPLLRGAVRCHAEPAMSVHHAPLPSVRLRPPARRPALSLTGRVLVLNSVVMVGACALLAFGPATVSSPIQLHELLVLVAGVVAAVGVNWLLLRRAFAPFEQLKRVMARVDPLRPGDRVPEDPADGEFADIAATFNDMMERLERERRESARRASAAEEAERRRVARDLHDEVGQRLGALLLRLQALQRAAPEPLRTDVQQLREELRVGLDEVRAIARRLRPEALDELGLSSALSALSTAFAHAGVHVRKQVDGDLPALTADEELTVFRVAQEALTNVARHAGTEEAVLELSRSDKGVRLRVSDAGRGFKAGAAGDGQGIRGMRERALMVGGRLDVTSVEGAGTRVDLMLEPESGR